MFNTKEEFTIFIELDTMKKAVSEFSENKLKQIHSIFFLIIEDLYR